MVAWYIISRHYKSRVKKNIGRMAEVEGIELSLFSNELCRSRTTIKEFCNANDVFANGVLTCGLIV